MINLRDYNDFFAFLGIVLLAAVVVKTLFWQRLKGIFISEKEARLKTRQKPGKGKETTVSIPSDLPGKLSKWLIVLIAIGFLFNQVLMLKIGFDSGVLGKLFSISIDISRK